MLKTQICVTRPQCVKFQVTTYLFSHLHMINFQATIKNVASLLLNMYFYLEAVGPVPSHQGVWSPVSRSQSGSREQSLWWIANSKRNPADLMVVCFPVVSFSVNNRTRPQNPIDLSTIWTSRNVITSAKVFLPANGQIFMHSSVLLLHRSKSVNYSLCNYKQDRRCEVKSNIEVLSCNHFCSGKGMNITQTECVYL